MPIRNQKHPFSCRSYVKPYYLPINSDHSLLFSLFRQTKQDIKPRIIPLGRNSKCSEKVHFALGYLNDFSYLYT